MCTEDKCSNLSALEISLSSERDYNQTQAKTTVLSSVVLKSFFGKTHLILATHVLLSRQAPCPDEVVGCKWRISLLKLRKQPLSVLLDAFHIRLSHWLSHRHRAKAQEDHNRNGETKCGVCNKTEMKDFLKTLKLCCTFHYTTLRSKKKSDEYTFDGYILDIYDQYAYLYCTFNYWHTIRRGVAFVMY